MLCSTSAYGTPFTVSSTLELEDTFFRSASPPKRAMTVASAPPMMLPVPPRIYPRRLSPRRHRPQYDIGGRVGGSSGMEARFTKSFQTKPPSFMDNIEAFLNPSTVFRAAPATVSVIQKVQPKAHIGCSTNTRDGLSWADEPSIIEMIEQDIKSGFLPPRKGKKRGASEVLDEGASPAATTSTTTTSNNSNGAASPSPIKRLRTVGSASSLRSNISSSSSSSTTNNNRSASPPLTERLCTVGSVSSLRSNVSTSSCSRPLPSGPTPRQLEKMWGKETAKQIVIRRHRQEKQAAAKKKQEDELVAVLRELRMSASVDPSEDLLRKIGALTEKLRRMEMGGIEMLEC
ncbi:MAG: hypothetical protein Q9179_002693 [Wetmoreana sp. 5 TL-2023]